MTRLAKLWIALVILTVWSPRAAAYDAQPVHRWLTRIAIERLIEAYPGQYDELIELIDAVVDGSEHEDDHYLDGDSDPATIRVQRHFYRPTDEAGLFMSDHQFPSSYEWGVLPHDGNAWGWDDAMDAYRRGDMEEAMYALGHVIHLVQDLTVPAHTHLDIHGPPTGDDFEVYCSAQTTDEYTSLLPLPHPGAPVPVFASALDAWRATAEASFYRNLYPGDLSDTAAARGLIAEMFPDLSWSWYSEEWQIDDPPVGSMGVDFHEEQTGWFYFENADHAASVDVTRFDALDPRSARYGANPDGATMEELFARDLIPVAIMHSAGVMKLFLDQAHDLGFDPAAEEVPDADEPPPGCRAAPDPAASWLLGLLVLFLARRRSSCAL